MGDLFQTAGYLALGFSFTLLFMDLFFWDKFGGDENRRSRKKELARDVFWVVLFALLVVTGK